jgi:hypothetical protein
MRKRGESCGCHSKEPIYFGTRHDHGHSLRRFRASDAVEPGRLDSEDLAVKKQQSRQRVVLGRGADPAIDRKMAEKRLDLRRAHVPGMTFLP